MRRIFIAIFASFFILCHWDKSVDTEIPPVSIVINEFMANNGVGVILDENNEADDWIELFNLGKSPASLNGLFLSDDSTKLDKFPFPDTVLPVNGHIVIWADSDEKQGKLHASFKLSAKNGEIILTQGDKTVIDRVQYDTSDISSRTSYGRWTDGAATWWEQAQPTPGKANVGGEID